MEIVNNISPTNVAVSNNKQALKTQSHLLNEPIQDSAEFSTKKRNKQSTAKWVFGGITALAGILIALRAHKNIKAKNIPATSPKVEEALPQIDVKLSKQMDEQKQQMSESIEKAEQILEEQQATTKQTIEDCQKMNEKFKKDIEKTQEELHKVKEKNKELDDLLEEMKKTKERNQKFWDDFNKNWEKSQEESKKNWEKWWEEEHKNWENFYNKAGHGAADINAQNRAQSGINIFNTFGKDTNGNTFEEIKNLGKIEDLTEEVLKRAHWKIVKKYYPIINTGTEAQKAEATEIMQQINPACDDIRAYLKSK